MAKKISTHLEAVAVPQTEENTNSHVPKTNIKDFIKESSFYINKGRALAATYKDFIKDNATIFQYMFDNFMQEGKG
jgi:hypothetical protein